MAHVCMAQCRNCNYWCEVINLPVQHISLMLRDEKTKALGIGILRGECFPVSCQKEKTLVYIGGAK